MNRYLKFTHLLFLSLFIFITACAASRETILARAPIEELNVQNSAAVKGYDSVAYFTEGKPVKGDPNINYQWKGATWYFSSQENRNKFIQSPEKYAPQYGGYCAFAIAQGNIADISPNQWAIVNDKLYLNNNAFSKSLWDNNRPEYIQSGDANWGITPRKPLSSLR